MKVLRTIFISIFVLVGMYFIPVVPTAIIDHDDPMSVEDEKVNAKISDEDLIQILHLVRGGYLLSAHEAMSLWVTNEILYISDSKETVTYQVGSKDQKGIVNPPVGKVVVSIGYICGELCGSGVTLYLDVKGEKWFVVKSNQWIS